MLLLLLSFMLGLSLLLPWNSLLKSIPYITMRIPSEWSDNVALWLTISFTMTNCVGLLVLTVSDADSRLIRRITGLRDTGRIIGVRLYAGLIGCALLQGIACLVPLTDMTRNTSASSGKVYLSIFWGIFLCTGLTMCLLQRSVYPLMNLIPGEKNLVIPMMLMGQAAAGIAASIGSFMFTGSGGGGAITALIYFSCSFSVLILTAILYRFYAVRTSEEKNPEIMTRFSIKMLWETARMVKPWPQLLAYNFIVTLALFPGLLTSSAHSLSSNRFFIPMTFLIFDIFDLIGKLMPSMIRRGFGPKSKMAIAFPLLRTLFIPAILLLPNFNLINLKLISSSDMWYFSLLALMSWTSGWGNAICLINGPQSVQSALTKEIGDQIGSLMGLAITFGLLCGSLASCLIKKLIIN